jgi:hypothetical protein
MFFFYALFYTGAVGRHHAKSYNKKQYRRQKISPFNSINRGSFKYPYHLNKILYVSISVVHPVLFMAQPVNEYGNK